MSVDMDTEISPTDNVEIYRRATTVDEPLLHHNHLQFINVYKDERVLLGAANLTGRYWNGSVWAYDKYTTFKKEEAFVSISTKSAVSDSVFIDHDKFVVAEDSGVLQVFSLADEQAAEEETKSLAQCLGYSCQHDDSILSTSIFENKALLVTGGRDRCIKVWNIESLLTERNYDGAHRKIVTCVDAKPKSNDVFASTSLDCEAVVWDVRKENPAEVIYEMPGRQLLAAAWSPSDENLICVGGNEGSVILVDIRKPRDFLGWSKVFKKSIHKLKYDTNRPNLLAVCCNDVEVKVVDDTKDFSTVYYDQRQHTDFVRGIAWHGSDLLTCAWDNTVVKHEIPDECQDVVK